MDSQLFFSCSKCHRIYLFKAEEGNFCPYCGPVRLEKLEGRFILRCGDCGLTQNKRAYSQLHGSEALTCQSSTCRGKIKKIQLGGARRSKTESSIQNSQNLEHSSNQNYSEHPAIPPRRVLPPKPENDRFRSQKLEIASEFDERVSAPPQNGSGLNISFDQFKPFPKSNDIKYPKKNHPGLEVGDFLELNGQQFKIEKKLGTGGMGAVWLGNSETKQAAIKEFHYSRYHDPESGNNHCEKYWKRESKITQIQSQSPEYSMHIIGSLKYVEQNFPEYYIFLDYIEGTPLDVWYTKRYKNLDNLTTSELQLIIREILQPICRHMYYVHQQGIIHRDLTVQNILIQEKGNHQFLPITIDWGVAKEREIDALYNPRKPYYVTSAPEATGIRNRGTPPEVMAGFQPIAATDIYMLGHIMFYLFSGGNYASTAATNEDFVLHPGDFNPNLPEDFNKVVEYMTQYEPADRMPNMIKAYEALQWLYDVSEDSQNPKKLSRYVLHCEWNNGMLELPEKQVIRLGRDQILACGTNHEMDGHLYNAILPNDGDQFSFQIYLEGGYAYIRDIYQDIFISQLTAANQQVYNNLPIKGVENCVIILSSANLGKTTLEIPYTAPDGITYRIPFRIILR